MSTEDWDELYALAAERHPDIHRALVCCDHAIRERVVALGHGAVLVDEEVVARMRDHDALTSTLRILRRMTG